MASVHFAAHALVDRSALGADFVVCSPYKLLGPHCAVLGAEPALLETIRPDKLEPSTNKVPERFEFGTLPYELMAGVTAAVEVLAGLAPGSASTRREALAASFAELHAHEAELLARLERGLAEFGDRVTVWSRAERRTPTLLMTFAGRAAGEESAFLAERGVHAPASNFYGLEASRALGLGDEGGLRAGIAPYTTAAEVDRLLEGLRTLPRGCPPRPTHGSGPARPTPSPHDPQGRGTTERASQSTRLNRVSWVTCEGLSSSTVRTCSSCMVRRTWSARISMVRSTPARPPAIRP